jgi:protocatechuate 3,4-dioxygenase beta subunit
MTESFFRRRFLQSAALGGAMFVTPGLFAEALTATARLTEGPFYPDKLPLDTDNDLLIINDSITPALGAITHLGGKLLTASGSPVRNAIIEIWQVDNNGVYLHSADGGGSRNDKNFQGYGKFMTSSKGEYYFRTIKPVPYPGRTPHIHVAVSQNGRRVLTTQLLINGHPQNDRDMVAREAGDNIKSILVDFKPLADSKIGELTANFDIVLGSTFKDAADEKPKGGVGKSEEGGAGGRGPRRPSPGGPGGGPGPRPR